MRLRLEAAASQLRHSRESIGRIALDCGFADQSHLTRAFSLHFGVPPARYRQAHRRRGESSGAMLE